jgi:hypothetical protein
VKIFSQESFLNEETLINVFELNKGIFSYNASAKYLRHGYFGKEVIVTKSPLTTQLRGDIQ